MLHIFKIVFLMRIFRRIRQSHQARLIFDFLPKKDSKKVKIFEIGSLEVYEGGGGLPRVYTVLRPYMYVYIGYGYMLYIEYAIDGLCCYTIRDLWTYTMELINIRRLKIIRIKVFYIYICILYIYLYSNKSQRYYLSRSGKIRRLKHI